MSPSGNPMEIVSALMQERQRYESWLATLEQRKSDTPPHVYERVRADYDARLQGVMSQLSERTAELQETLSVLEARLARVLAEENSKRDARYEAELRAAVGEFTTTEWNDLLRKSDEEIARLTTERGGISTELARVRQIYAMANTRKHEEQTALSLGAGGDAASRADAKGDAKKESGGRKSKDVASGAANAGFDELAFLNSLGDAGARQSGGAAAAPPAASAQSDGASTTAGPAAPAAGAVARQPTPAAASAGIAKGGVAPPAGGAGRPTPVQPVAAQSAPAAPPKAEPKPAAKPAPKPEPEKLEVTRSKRDTNGVPSFLKDVPEQIKTLKCAECGTMNYPTEWYCERCGGELAAM